MSEKNKLEVIIAGEAYTLSGEDSREHMERVSEYLKQMETGTARALGGRAVGKEYMLSMMAINLSDDAVKLAEHVSLLSARLEKSEKQNKILEKTVADYEDELRELEMQLMELRDEITALKEAK